MHEPEQQVRVPKTGELVANRLRQRIVSGEFPPGHRLPPEEELTIQFGVARTTLREALRILESQGLISIRRGRGGGGVVTEPQVERLADGLAVTLQLQQVTIGDLDEARQVIEPQLAARWARRNSPADLAALTAVVDKAAERVAANDVRGFTLAAAEVHETLIERSGNTTLAVLSRLLHEMVEQYYLSTAPDTTPEALDRAIRSYRKLLRLIEAGNAAGAEEHWRRLMTFTIDRRNAHERLDMYAARAEDDDLDGPVAKAQ